MRAKSFASATTGPVLTWRTLPSYLLLFNDSTPPASSPALVLGSRALRVSFTSTAAESGPTQRRAKGPRFISRSQQNRTPLKIPMSSHSKRDDMTTKPILLVEDTPDDAELTVMSLKQSGLLNNVVV